MRVIVCPRHNQRHDELTLGALEPSAGW
ncbi:hypothetical protein E2C01_083529 [Portunus trituberculatus]|uniref:Uncharacterized protein n=1 Tax=Portunus trituberculatus TaxID=210409 RepID=A0A5B7J2B8_PORTR|nr:hypothetical protein [Portunus trituberculatus]